MTASVRIEDLIAVHANTGGKGEPLRASRRSTPPPVQRLVKRLPLAGTDETVAQGHAAQLLGHRAGIGPAPQPLRVTLVQLSGDVLGAEDLLRLLASHDAVDQ